MNSPNVVHSPPPMSPRAQHRPFPSAFWILLCFVLAVGLAFWSLYFVGLLALMVAAPLLAFVPKARQVRMATTLAVAIGYEATLISWIVRDLTVAAEAQRSDVSVLAGVAGAGGLVLAATLWAVTRTPSAPVSRT